MNSLVHFIIGVFGNVSAILLFLVPVITFKRIVQKRSTEQFSGIPYVMTLLNCFLNTWYGLPFVSPDNLLLSTVSATGAVIETIYLFIFLVFSPKKEKGKIALLVSIVVSVFGAVVVISLFALHGHTRKLFCGLIATIFSVLMYASPLTIVRMVIKTKSVEFMPFFLSLFVFLCSTLWFVFGLIEGDPFVYIENGFGCGLGIVQLVLYATYHKNKGGGTTAHDGSIEFGQKITNEKVTDKDKEKKIITSNIDPSKLGDQV